MPDEFSGRYLAAGARVAVVAPSGPFDLSDFERGLGRLRERYLVRCEPAIGERCGFLAGSDARRLAELQGAIDDDALDAIFAARGGYGATRLLGQLDLSRLRERPKLLVGFSDISALHAQWARAELLSVHGGMVAALGRSEQHAWQRYRAALEGDFQSCIAGLACLAPGRAEGILVGGNLAVLTALLGTPHALPCARAILFFEDIGERPYRLDRMLTTWRAAGAFAGVRGVALGAFVDCEAGRDRVSALDVLSERLTDLGIPVVAGVPAGHLDDNLELPFGRRVLLDAVSGELHVLPRKSA